MHRLASFLLLLFSVVQLHAKPVEIVMWYSLAGHLGSEIRKLAGDFNKTQSEYVVKPIYKGEYIESLTSFAAAFSAKQPPAIIQVFELGTDTMLQPKGIIKPVDELMTEQGLHLPKDSFLPVVRALYSRSNQLLAFPFNISIPVIYYNADALMQIGYSEHSFPKTWDKMEVLAAQLKKAGFACAYTSAYPAWIQIESFSALHGLSLVNQQKATVIDNNKAIISHLERLKKWQKKHYFEYGGRASDATFLFTSGRCALFSQSSGSYNSLSELVHFRLGVAAMPLDTKISSSRHNNVAGGAALWVGSGQSAEIYRGVAYFFSYLAQPSVQNRWHQQTGYLPLGLSGVYASIMSKSKHPILALAQSDLADSHSIPSQPNLGPQNQVRMINDEALEAVFSGIKSPKQAIDEAEKQANYALLRFSRNTYG